MEIHYRWDNEKNKVLKKVRGISFEQITLRIDKGNLVDIVEHPNQKKYSSQKMLVVNINKYIYLVPFVEEEKNIYFLKTIIPSRKATKKYKRGEK